MRLPVPEHQIIYVRFHRTAMDIIYKLSERTNRRPATIASTILHEYMTLLYCRCGSCIEQLEEGDLSLSPLASAFFLQRGRSSASMLGKPMNLTVDKKMNRDMTLIAHRFDMSVQNFRIAIIITYGLNNELIR